MTEQTPMTYEHLETCYYNAKLLIQEQQSRLQEMSDEIRRLREIKEQLNTLITQQGNRLWDAAEEINRLKEGYEKILEYPLTGAAYADIAEAMRYRQIARSMLQEVEKLEKGQTTNNQAGDE